MTRSSLGCIAILAAFLAVAAATRLGAAASEEGDAGLRTWTDSSGKYKVSATFLGMRDDKVRLKKEDGSIIEVPLVKLSAADRERAQALQAKLDAASKTRPPEENPFDNAPADADTPSLQELTRRVEGGIVFVASRDPFGSQIGLGSGFVIDGSGLVATNYHVIKDAASAWVKFRDGAEVEVTGYRLLDKKHDLALLQLKAPPKSVAVLQVDTKDELKQGDAILAIGHPGGFEFTVSNGIISAIRKTAEMPEQIRQYLASDPECVWVQISAPSAAGSSGGPLLNARGRVVGLVTLVAPAQNIAFAVHAQHLATLHSRVSDKVYPLPVPGSFQGPGVTEPQILDQLAQFRHDLELMFARLQSVVSDEKQREIYETENPVPAHMVKFRKLAESQRGTRVEFEALVTIARLPYVESASSKETRRWAYARLVEGYAGAEPLGGLMLELCKSASRDAQAFMREVIGRSPHQQVQGLGCLALGLALMGNPQTRGRGEEECVTWLERARTEFGTVEVGDTTLAEIVTPLAREAKSLAVGRPAAEVEGKDSKDQPFRLSDYRGKIVLLDFWVDWCPYCRAMYPHERALLEKHAGKPFAILGVNCEDADRMRKVEASGAVTWRSWADGPGGPIAGQWNVTGYPTLYLIDGSGRIRRKGYLQGAVLDSAVDALVKELDLGLAHDLIEPSAVWNYYDRGQAPKPDWNVAGFDDSEWKSGRGILGYGQGDEATALDFGPDEQAKTPTAYFRRTFKTEAPPTAPGLVLGLLAAGGTAVYLNGQEVLRDNLAPRAATWPPGRRLTQV
jgi:thiol-disulfide isomerase/thioredoxin